jgi:hypothetical protein
LVAILFSFLASLVFFLGTHCCNARVAV